VNIETLVYHLYDNAALADISTLSGAFDTLLNLVSLELYLYENPTLINISGL